MIDVGLHFRPHFQVVPEARIAKAAGQMHQGAGGNLGRGRTFGSLLLVTTAGIVVFLAPCDMARIKEEAVEAGGEEA